MGTTSHIQDATSKSERLEQAKRAADIYHEAFRDDPVLVYMLCNLSETARHAYLYKFFSSLLKGAALNEGIFDHTEDWTSCSVLMPPKRRADNIWTIFQAGFFGVLWKLGISGCKRLLIDCARMSESMKAKVLKGEDYYYIWWLATDVKHRHKGLGTELIRMAQKRAEADQVPLWLESSTPYSHQLYLKLGFKDVGYARVGKGHAAPDGTAQPGGEGVEIWMMLWRPEKAQ